MGVYIIVLHDDQGATRAMWMRSLASDDDAIDYAGRIDHADEMTVCQADREDGPVSRFPPLLPGHL